MKLLATLLTLFFLASNAWASAQHGIEIHDPWVREAPPTARVLAAYLQLHNHDDKTRTLVSVESPAFKRVELHRSEEKEGMATMTRVAKIMIAAHGKVIFEPGSLHIMLIDPVTPLKAGDKVSLTLRFNDGSSLDINADVRRSGGVKDKAHHHDPDHSMDMQKESHGDMKKHEHDH
ncbi:MAG: copper chaperone PCu(A)C [Gammaproteobacteria bacterium]|nr:copper chaperone PCu(A)C [Gammaproteobacteria bacterium]MCF6362903.1 copper chaperone PCu(A)C [Gammaproteobacteria bacterium]